MKCASMCFTHNLSFIAELQASNCPRMRFLKIGHLIFWMGMFKVFRWNGLEILIPKHMWKSQIGPLEQI